MSGNKSLHPQNPHTLDCYIFLVRLNLVRYKKSTGSLNKVKGIMPHRVKEFHFITPISNIISVLKHGILSRNAIQKLGIKHSDISMPEMQERRKLKRIPNGKPLHDYANLYFDARNPMLFKRQKEVSEICVLAVSREVLNLLEL